MGKWEKYTKTFNRQWLNGTSFSNWLQDVKDDSNKADCKVYKVQISAHNGDLKKKHSDSVKHI